MSYQALNLVSQIRLLGAKALNTHKFFETLTEQMKQTQGITGVSKTMNDEIIYA
jgi:hypothetical protein